MIIIQNPRKDWLESEEKRKIEVIRWFYEQREQAYSGVNEWVWKAQLKLSLMTRSEYMLFAINNQSTFDNSISLEKMDIGHIATDDQGFEGQIILKNGEKYFERFVEFDI